MSQRCRVSWLCGRGRCTCLPQATWEAPPSDWGAPGLAAYTSRPWIGRWPLNARSHVAERVRGPLPHRMISRCPGQRRRWGMLELPATGPDPCQALRAWSPKHSRGGRPGSVASAAGLPCGPGGVSLGCSRGARPWGSGESPRPPAQQACPSQSAQARPSASGMLLCHSTPRTQGEAVLRPSP